MLNRSCRMIAAAVALAAISSSALAVNSKISDIANTRHNLSSSGTGTVKATSETQICVFCHTPHKANAAANAPLWNRALSGETYTDLYESGSLDAYAPGSGPQPSGSSKLCLSCHDGTMALGSVGVLDGQENVSISGVGATTMPAGSGATTGFTRNLGTNLSNDHPISFTYDAALAGSDGELLDPVAATHIGTGTPRHPIPLEVGADTENKLQCTSCHDPHIRDTDLAKNAKFLRLNRFQESSAVSQGSFVEATDQICLGCHSKSGWSTSAHAVSTVANEVYTDAAADLREFPRDLPVWQAGCLNCHDTHTVQGARRLLREGTTDTNVPKQGGNPAQEQTCYQCHTTTVDGGQVLKSTTPVGDAYAVPDIKSDFTTAGNRAMPIATTEVHEVTDSNLKETQALLNTRHAECTDCHNPHRVLKNSRADGTGTTTSGTHEHTSTAMHTNAASGVLKGMWGVDTPVVGSLAWGTNPTYSVVDSVTKEYQVCLKCHSSYAYGTTPPFFANATENPNGTPTNTNGFTTSTRYTDQGMELQAPTNDKGESTANHRSWHPVIAETGRNVVTRGNMTHTNFLAPWNNTTAGSIGSQTMYCTDCHGSETAMGTSAPTAPNPWGPHGSGKDFILKGNWDADATTVMANGNATITNPVSLCFRCHDYNAYSNVANNTAANVVNFTSGFSSSVSGIASANTGAGCAINATVDNNNLHLGHRGILAVDLRCSWCHAAVPHGWKNKALLVNVQESTVCAGVTPCNDPPYYVNAMLGGNITPQVGINWKTSGNWDHLDCGGANMGAMAADTWMNGSCNPPP